MTTILQNVTSRYLIRTRLSDGIDSVPVPALTFFSSILDQVEGDGYDFIREALHPYGWGIGHPDHSVADDIQQYASSSLPLVNAILEHAFYADQHSAVELLEGHMIAIYLNSIRNPVQDSEGQYLTTVAGSYGRHEERAAIL
ncbi:hypothetical protein SAMN05216226_111136 [Halovenus aranensis]|uniref:Uncharacterized protein n=1 Tax=Halovenus aranensis TaxID=890420 RepID=A0A1G8XKS0_9EURY|nr:hypothetical protein [Halovenus aranensis]SDJ91043.1 hypothetical protein SAMN05216226_111136 [Halovenus aranensis]